MRMTKRKLTTLPQDVQEYVGQVKQECQIYKDKLRIASGQLEIAEKQVRELTAVNNKLKRENAELRSK